MLRVKEILDKLNSLVSSLENEIEETKKVKDEAILQKKKQDELQAGFDKKAQELNERELKVKHIESIEKAIQEAKDLGAKAKTLMDNADERQGILETGLKKLAKDNIKLDKDKEDFRVEQARQIEAFNKEKDTFNGKKKIFNDALGMTKGSV